MNKADRFGHIAAAFQALSDLEPEPRKTALEALRASDPEVADEIDKMFRAESQASLTLGPAAGPGDEPDLEARIGEEFEGRYRIDRLIGQRAVWVAYSQPPIWPWSAPSR